MKKLCKTVPLKAAGVYPLAERILDLQNFLKSGRDNKQQMPTFRFSKACSENPGNQSTNRKRI
jgi:hypothetical protein